MTLYLITGSCAQTEAELRLELADLVEAVGDVRGGLEWRAVVARMRRDWRKRATIHGMPTVDPDSLVPVLATPENPLFWHEPRRNDTLVCPCGHFADYLCDTPVGRGRTCDRPMCRCCRNEIAPGIDRCPYHEAVERKAARPA